MSETYLQAETTIDSREGAGQLAAEMVRRRLAACAQVVGPIRSTYWWQGDVQEEEEWLVLFKTRGALLARFKDALAELHPYDTPEILIFDVLDGGRSYLEWIASETAQA